MRLLEYVSLEGTLRLKTGLYIGTGEQVEKREALPVMRSIRTGLPYIPGSSIKGKMRCLLELTYGQKEVDPEDNGSPCWCGKCQICTLFGSGSTKKIFEPTRLIFRDCYLTPEFKEKFEEIGFEEKTGIRIDRNTGAVGEKALFNIKRVPEGFEFYLQISVRIFEKDLKDSIKKWLAMGLLLMEQDTLGGGGTRGSGYIEFDNLKFDEEEFDKDWRETCKREKEKLLEVQIKSKE